MVNQKKPHSRHHYVPEFYLKGFVDPYKGCVWRYEKGGEIIPLSTKDAAVIRDYHSFKKGEGEKDSETFEDFFNRIESKASLVIRKIIDQEILSEEEKAIFSLFIALMMVRVPNYRINTEKMIADIAKSFSLFTASDPEAFKKSLTKYEHDTGDIIDIPAEELREFILDDSKYTIKTNPEISLGLSAMSIESLAPVFFKMNWTFIYASRDYKFVTSDNPLFYDDPTHNTNSSHGVGLLSKNVEVTFPISRDVALFCSWGKKRKAIQVTNKMVKTINRRTISAALKYVFAPNRADGLNKIVQDLKNSAPIIQID